MAKNWAAVAVSFLLLLSVAVVAAESHQADSGRSGHRDRGFMQSLTEEQREAVRDRMAELREAGATHQEMRASIAEMLEEYGVEPPETCGKGRGRKGFHPDLTEEQRETVREKIAELREAGVERGEIRAAVDAMLEEYGVELPAGAGHRFGPPPFMADLTDEQREALHVKMSEMRSEGATREEIRSAMGEILEGYGVELPEHWGEGRSPRGFFGKLTGEQREAVREKMREMRGAGASREEVRAAVRQMLEQYGIEPRAHPKDSPQGTMSLEETSTSADLTDKFQSYANPNPFSRETIIFYTLGAENEVQVEIYNSAGQLVKSFDIGVQDPGTHSLQWDGTYENGVAVPGGVYLYRVEAGGEAVTGRLVLLK